VALILVADDDEKVCRWLRTVLELEGYRVIEAADGRQALHTIQRQSPPISSFLMSTCRFRTGWKPFFECIAGTCP
jgi:CheY-like chemotaxis protein